MMVSYKEALAGLPGDLDIDIDIDSISLNRLSSRIMDSMADDTEINDIDSEPVSMRAIGTEDMIDPSLFEVSSGVDDKGRELTTEPAKGLDAFDKLKIDKLSLAIHTDTYRDRESRYYTDQEPVTSGGRSNGIQEPSSHAKPTSSSSLLSILNGNNKKEKKGLKSSLTAKKKAVIPIQNPIVTHFIPLESSDSEISDNLDSSFTESKSNQYKHDHEVMELEKKIYAQNIKAVSAKDLFSRLKKDELVVEIDPIIIEDDLESKVYGNNAKRTSAKNLFKSLRRKDLTPQVSGIKSFPIVLKISPTKLAEVKKYDNPFKTKGNDTFVGTNSTTSTDFFKQKPKSLFDSLMNASKNSVKLTPLQKLKELHPPSLTNDQFHVKEDQEKRRIFTLSFPLKKPREVNIDGDQNVLLLSTPLETSLPYCITVKDEDIESLVHKQIPNLSKVPQLNSLYNRFFIEPIEIKKHELWIHLFQPETMEDLLMAPQNILTINNWIKNSFKRLKSQSLKNPRNVLIQQQKKRKQRKADFIVDDYFDVSDTEEDIFVPLLILQGSVGSCKSSAIYSAMREINGYVHEINTGLDRGRKDIYHSLKEFCTTQIVHKNNEKTFQQGIVLLEEVNILFEQDKGFWLAVQDILNISRRPVVLTCENLLNIPKTLLDYSAEDDSIVRIDDNVILKGVLMEYLWLAALSQGFDVDHGIINRIVQKSYNGQNYDIRKCLMECQLLCQPYKRADKLVSISQHPKQDVEAPMDLGTLASHLETLSCADILTTNTISLINHTVQSNELVDIDWLDDNTHQRLPYETEIGSFLAGSLNINQTVPTTNQNYKSVALDYIGSRSKKLPKFIQELQTARRSTRSFTSTPQPEDPREMSVDTLTNNWALETTGIPETSFMNYINPQPLYTEVLPYCRLWARFQHALDRIEENALQNGGESIKRFLNFRDFQQDPTMILGTLTIA